MYQFKFQALLNHRRHEEEVCQKELAEAQRDLADAQEKRKTLEQEKRENVQRLHAQQKERHNAANVLMFTNYIEQLSRDIEVQEQLLQHAAQKVNRKRDRLITVMKKRKTLEKLKEKGRLAYQQKIMRAERKFNDEVAATRHVREM
jgi:flagellar export protein FliJ